jgi:hypothetical protein
MKVEAILLLRNQTNHNQFYICRINIGHSRSGTKHTIVCFGFNHGAKIHFRCIKLIDIFGFSKIHS